MSTTSRLVVPSTSMSPEMSKDVAVMLELNVAAPAAEASRVIILMVEPPSFP